MPILNGNITETVEIDSNGIYDVARYTSANVNIEPIPPVIEELSITPTTSEQSITAPSGTDGYSPITVSAVDNTIDANITANNIKSGISILGVSGSVVESNETTLNVTPTTSAQSLTPSSPYTGYNEVNVSAVTSSIDANIIPGNIKKDVTILGVTGTHEGGTTPTGTKNITINGTYDVTNYASANVQVPTSGPTYYIERTASNGVLYKSNNLINLSGITNIGPSALKDAYNSCNIKGTADLSSLTTLSYDYACSGMLVNTRISSLDMSNLTTVSGNNACAGMCANCTQLLSADLSSLTSITGNWGCYDMFEYCTHLQTVDLSSLETVTNGGIAMMFTDCNALTSVDLSSLQTCNSLYQTFNMCTSLTNLNLGNLTSCDDLYYAFNYCKELVTLDLHSLESGFTEIDCFNTTFRDCWELEDLRLGNLSDAFQYISRLEYTFFNCVKLPAQSIQSFITPITTLTHGSHTFYACSRSLAEQQEQGVSGISFTNLTTLDGTIDTSYGYESTFINMLGEVGFGTIDFPALTTLVGNGSTYSSQFQYLFAGAYSHHINFPALTTVTGTYLFLEAFSYCNYLYAMVFPSFDTLSSSNNYCFYKAFEGCENLKHLSFPSLSTIPTTTRYKYAFNDMLTGCSNVIVHFPMAKASTLGTWASVTNGFGGTATSVEFDLVTTITDSNGDTFIHCGKKDQYIDKEIFDTNSNLNGKMTIDIAMKAWVKSGEDPDTDGYYLTLAKGNTVSTNGWSNSEPEVNDTLYQAVVNGSEVTYTAYSTVASIA